VSYQFGSATLAAGDLLLIFTDGLVEAEDDGSASTVNNECYRWCKRSTAVPRKR
jgi:serine phosphatase RsbU (regulator of sigma subunit)